MELLLKSRNDYEYLVFVDHKPAGAEAVELVSGWNWDAGLPYYQELRDEGAVIYIERLPRGETSLRYRLRAEAPGQFTALPTTGHAMYAPEIRANSEGAKVRIEDRPSGEEGVEEGEGDEIPAEAKAEVVMEAADGEAAAAARR